MDGPVWNGVLHNSSNSNSNSNNSDAQVGTAFNVAFEEWRAVVGNLLLVIFNDDLPLAQGPGMEFNAVSEAWEGGPRTTDLVPPSDSLRMNPSDHPRTTDDQLRPNELLRMRE
jgi:hypothetical protein